jgi:hypothetical protein
LDKLLQKYFHVFGLPAGHEVGKPRDGGGPLLPTVVDAGVPVQVFFAIAMERFTVEMVFIVRNIGIAITISVTVLG